MRASASPASSAGPFTLRGWLVVAGGVATGLVILASWFPLGALLHQRAQLSAAASRLSQLTAEGRSLAAATERLSSHTAQLQLAREEYQLVAPGQHLILVEAPSLRLTKTRADVPFPGDPGFSPLAVPGSTSGLAEVSQSGAAGSSKAGSSGTSSVGTAEHLPAGATGATGFVSRVVATFEFWR